MKRRFAWFVCLALAAIVPQVARAEAPQFVSEYTSLTECKTIATPQGPDKSGPRDFFRARCPGRDGHTVYNEAGDVHGWLRLTKGKSELRLGAGEEKLIGGSVSGKTLEWRYRVQDGRRQLVALIYRVKGNDRAAYEAGDMNKLAEYLSAVRPTEGGACAIGLATTNDAAHALADSGKPCKPE